MAAAAVSAIISRKRDEEAAQAAASPSSPQGQDYSPVKDNHVRGRSTEGPGNAETEFRRGVSQTSRGEKMAKFSDALDNVRSQMETFMQMIDTLAELHESEIHEIRMRSCPSSPRVTKAGPGVNWSRISEIQHAQQSPPLQQQPLPPFDEKAILPGFMPPPLISHPSTPSASVVDGAENIFDDATRPPPSLKDIMIKGTEEEIGDLLELGADPNEQLGRYVMFGKEFDSGTPLVIAVLRGKMSLMHMLLDYGANPDSMYSFEAGAEQLIWSGTAIHGTIPANNLEMMEALLDRRADLQTVGSNKSTLLWQAAYFGKPQLAEFLLKKRVDIEQRAFSQDDTSKTYTPLHAAARAGNGPIVSLLLKNKAQICVDDKHNSHPLDDAISQGHNDIVQTLVQNCANLFRPIDARTRTIDNLFNRGDPMMVTACAKGLQKAVSLLNRLPASDLTRFLLTEGEAPVKIMASIIQPYRILYWDIDEKGKKIRVLRTAACISADLRMAVAEGPHNDHLMDLFNKKDHVEGTTKTFLTHIGSDEPLPGLGKQLFVPSTFYMCHVPNMHTDLNVLLALVDCPSDNVFGELSTRAVLTVMWRKENFSAKCRMGISAIEVLNLVLLNFILNELDHSDLNIWLLRAANIMAFLVFLLVLFLHLLQFVGYCSSGLLSRILLTPGFWMTNSVIFLTGTCVYVVAAWNFEAKESVEFCTSLGVIIFIKWMRLLVSLSTLKSVGLRILPITSTMLDIGPFCAVMGVYLVGSTNMYYALGIYNFPRCFLIIYRLVVMADVDPNELENVWPSQMNLQDNGYISQSVSPGSEYYVVVRLMLIFFSFVIGLTMMNLFVAVLCLAYDKAARNADFAFARNMARLLLDHEAMRIGARSFQGLCQRRQKQSKDFDSPYGRERSASCIGLEPREDQKSDFESKKYIWACVQKEDS
eukprot:TRINITY_DN14299_c0_g2_i1.p1 TRINITY_DN14299_c0_g2~~TRINITY_DN14299_c0_g2_i1.p1  ORF type:complete len:929 (+),score=117.25 TRINITY_DN14299_c0_g2_i1:38-2824(+)